MCSVRSAIVSTAAAMIAVVLYAPQPALAQQAVLVDLKSGPDEYAQFPPRQRPASFSVDQVIEKLEATGKGE